MNEHDDILSAAGIDSFLRRNARRRTLRIVLLGFFAAMTTAGLSVSLTAWLQGGVARPIAPLLLALASAALLAHLFFATWRERQRYRALAAPTREAVQGALSALSATRRAHLLVLAALPAIAMLFAIATWQLVERGDMTSTDAASFAVLLGVALVTVTGVQLHRLRTLSPQRAQLERLLRSLH